MNINLQNQFILFTYFDICDYYHEKLNTNVFSTIFFAVTQSHQICKRSNYTTTVQENNNFKSAQKSLT